MCIASADEFKKLWDSLQKRMKFFKILEKHLRSVFSQNHKPSKLGNQKTLFGLKAKPMIKSAREISVKPQDTILTQSCVIDKEKDEERSMNTASSS